MGPRSRKQAVNDFFRYIQEGRPKEGLKLCAPGCVQHNPYVKGGMDALYDSMSEAMKSTPSGFSDPELKVRFVLEDGNYLAAYTQLLGSRADPSKGGLRQVHLFRFGGDKIVEYWDVTQAITPGMGNATGSF